MIGFLFALLSIFVLIFRGNLMQGIFKML